MLTTSDKQIVATTVGGVNAQLAQAQRRADTARDKKQAKEVSEAAAEAERLAFFDRVLSRVHQGFWNVAALTTQSDLLPLYESLKAVDKTFTLWSETDGQLSVGVLLRQERVGVYIVEYGGHKKVGYMTSRYSVAQTERWYRPDRKTPPPCFAMWFGDSFQHPDWTDFGSANDSRDAAKARERVSNDYLQQLCILNFSDLKKQSRKTAAWLKEEGAHYFVCRSAWIEDRISPAQVLGKFFYDCADATVLQQHLSNALKQLRA